MYQVPPRCHQGRVAPRKGSGGGLNAMLAQVGEKIRAMEGRRGLMGFLLQMEGLVLT